MGDRDRIKASAKEMWDNFFNATDDEMKQCLDCEVHRADVDEDFRCGDCRKSNPDYGAPI